MNNNMCYDPVKQLLGEVFSRTTWLRRLLYRLLDALMLRSWHMHREIKIWSRNHPNGTHILDAGCGFGQYSYYLYKINRQYSILGIDKKANQIVKCNDFIRKKGIQNIYFKTANVMTFVQEKAFNLVLCVDVMQYVEDDKTAFNNYYNSLKENGILLMSCPTDTADPGADGNPVKPDDSELVRAGYDVASLKKYLRSIGFKKVRFRHTYGKPGQLSWMLSIKFPLMMVNFSRIFVAILPLYYLIIFPVGLVLNFMDTHMGHLAGKAFILKAYK